MKRPKILRYLLQIVLLCAVLTGAAQAAGRPSLDANTRNEFISYLEWIYQIKLSQQAAGRLLANFENEWNSRDPATYKSVEWLRSVITERRNTPQNRLASLRAQHILPFIFYLYDDSQKGDEDQLILRSAYERQHPNLVHGQPPLTDEIANLNNIYMSFIVKEGSRSKIAPSPGIFQQNFIASYSAQSTNERYQTIENIYARSAFMQESWPLLPENERNALRSDWQKVIQGDAPSSPPSRPRATGQAKSGLTSSQRAALISEQLRIQHETRMNIINNMRTTCQPWEKPNCR